MSDVAFVFSNPRHHYEMMAPVADELARRRVATSLVSLAELRGFETPTQSGARRVIPLHVRRRPPMAAEPTGEREAWKPGRLSQRLVWLALWPRLRWMLRRARV